MPERKGRKRRPRERRRSHDQARDESAVAGNGHRPAATPSRARSEPSRPALRVRYAGFFLGVLTMFVGVLTVAQGVVSSGANAALLLVIGAFLVALALALGALSLVPDRVRALFER